MRTLFHTLVFLSIGLWIGALVFFASILAPIAFTELPPLFANQAQGIHAAGVVVGDSLARLHWMGFGCGIVFLAATLFARRHYRSVIPQTVLIAAMLVFTAYSQFSIISRMNTARESVGGNIEAVALNNPGREIFDRLHRESVQIESVILLCGLGALIAAAHFARREV